MGDTLPQGPQLVTTLQSLQYSTFVDVCAFTILIYDCLITFDKERNLIWPMSFRSPAKALFFVTRYLPFIDMSICISQHFRRQLTVDDCSFGAKSMGWLISFGLLFSEVILTLRTWAVWERSRALAVGLSIWFAIIWIPSLVITGIFLKSIVYTTMPSHLPGCLAVSGSPIDFADWVLLMVYEAGILTLMIIQAVQKFKVQGHSSIYRTVYRDGTVFYLYLFVLSTANIVAILTFPIGMTQILTNFERVIHSVLTGRILLALRNLASKPSTEDSFPVGNNSYLEMGTFETGTSTSSRPSEMTSRSTGRQVFISATYIAKNYNSKSNPFRMPELLVIAGNITRYSRATMHIKATLG